jgi:hypothetical protein
VRPTRIALALAALLALAAVACGCSAGGGSTAAAAQPFAKLARKLPSGAAIVDVGAAARSRPIASGFLGLSLEFPAVTAYAGHDPAHLDPVFLQLVRNLTPGQSPSIRIGGDSTDWTWWPAPGISRPAGAPIRLNPGWAAVTRAVATALRARLILGLQLEADSVPVAVAEAHAYITDIGSTAIDSLEPGNEPELYGSFIWDGSGRTGRPHNYDFNGFLGDFSRVAHALPHSVPLAGPSSGSPKWYGQLNRFLNAEPRVRVATLHRYPLQVCGVNPDKPRYPTIANLMSQQAARSLADSVARYPAIAHGHGVAIRIGEMNTISCGAGPAVNAVGQSFAAALWALDALFEMARVGVDGVNMHSYPKAPYELFTFSQRGSTWSASVKPEYYGMLMFAQAAPPGARLLRTATTRQGDLRTWATRATDGTIRVVVINDGSGLRTVAVRMPSALGTGTIERLLAPSPTSQGGVTIGRRSFGSSTTTGALGPPRTSTVTPSGRTYTFNVPAGSAALLTLAPAPAG